MAPKSLAASGDLRHLEVDSWQRRIVGQDEQCEWVLYEPPFGFGAPLLSAVAEHDSRGDRLAVVATGHGEASWVLDGSRTSLLAIAAWVPDEIVEWAAAETTRIATARGDAITGSMLADDFDRLLALWSGVLSGYGAAIAA